MIAKEKKQAIIAEFGRSEGDTRISGSTGSDPDSKNQRADRSLQSKSKKTTTQEEDF